MDSSERHGLIASVDTLEELLVAHSGKELDDADRVAQPSDLLKGLLGADY